VEKNVYVVIFKFRYCYSSHSSSHWIY